MLAGANRMWIDAYLSPTAHQIVGMCIGIILCAWFVSATSEQVAIIRLPAVIVTFAYVGVWLVGVIWRLVKRPNTYVIER